MYVNVRLNGLVLNENRSAGFYIIKLIFFAFVCREMSTWRKKKWNNRTTDSWMLDSKNARQKKLVLLYIVSFKNYNFQTSSENHKKNLSLSECLKDFIMVEVVFVKKDTVKAEIFFFFFCSSVYHFSAKHRIFGSDLKKTISVVERSI